MNEEMIIIGRRIRNKREQQGLSREKLSEMANISSQFLADIETGKKGMTVSTLKKLCDALCVSSDAIVYGEQNITIDDEIKDMLKFANPESHELLLDVIRNIIKLCKHSEEKDY